MVPTTVFAHPPLVDVGLTEAEAAAQGLKFKVKHEVTTKWFTSRPLREPASARRFKR